MGLFSRKPAEDARKVLDDISTASSDRDVRANTGFWAKQTGSNDRDRQSMAWALLDASGDTSLPFEVRKAARKAAGEIEDDLYH